MDFEIEDSCYVNDKFIGTTVSKKITVNILNPDNNINIENKEIVVNTGIVIDGEEELVPFGNFIIEKPTNEETKQKIKFIGYDYMIKFNKKYEDNITYPIKLKEYLRKLCEQAEVELGSTELINGEYEIQGNPFTNNEDCKTVLSNIAQLCGGFAHIGRDNKLYITNLGGESQETIDGNSYFSLEKNEQYGEVNSLVIRLSQVEGENTAKEDAESVKTNGLTEITIADNYFLNKAEEREKVIDAIFNNLKGLKYTPINSSYYGFPYLDTGDAITVLDSKDVEYTTYILNHKFKYNGGFSGNIETLAVTKTQTAYKNTMDIKTKFQNVELKVDKINGEITSKIEDQNKKISQTTQTVDKINSKISDISDLTISKESINGTVSFEKINQSEPIYVRIYPTGESISYLYPHANLYPSETLFLKNRKLRFTNKTTNEYVDYELPSDLLYYDAENYDEFILDYSIQKCVVNKKVGYNADGTTYVLENPTTIECEYPKIQLKDGDYTVELLGYNNAYIFVKLMAQNIYTTQFATKAEVDSEIKQTVNEVEIGVNKKLSNYSTTTQMNAAINVKADEITQGVKSTYATKDALATEKSERKQTATKIKQEVSKKVGEDEVISKINQSAEAVGINANKIELSAEDVLNLLAGNTINLSGRQIKISSNNFTVDENGNLWANLATLNNVVINNGKINIKTNSGSTAAFNIINEENETEKSTVRPTRIETYGTNGYSYMIAEGDTSDSSGFICSDSNGSATFKPGLIRNEPIYNDISSSSANLIIDSAGQFHRSTNTSSKRYKTEITKEITEELNPSRLYDLQVKQFKYKEKYQPNKNDARYNKDLIGFIAEEIAEIYPIAVDYERGEVESWNERYMIPAMLKLIQEQHKDIEELKGRVNK